jgi:bifunctional UDP-N-acetylglucosamine pyrophosphorylase / glucosamine-1-phosphate N-acetyltransferase
MVAPADLFDLEGVDFADIFSGLEEVWEVLDRIKDYTTQAVLNAGCTGAILRGGGEVLPRTVVMHGARVFDSDFQLLGGDPTKGQMRVRLNGQEVSDAAVVYAGAVFMSDLVHIAPGAVVEPGALLNGPSFIGPGTEVRQGAYLRGGCLVGAGCVVGHATEVKNSIMLDGAKAGHFAYLGDSVLGRDVNLGAGTKLANLKIIDRPYHLKVEDTMFHVARRKFGAILGDGCETGCNSVTNPGTVMGQRSLVAPCVSVPAGWHKPKSIVR